LGLWAVRRAYRPRLDSIRQWVGLLNAAEWQERYASADDFPTGSTFELLIDASQEIPRWIRLSVGIKAPRSGSRLDRLRGWFRSSQARNWQRGLDKRAAHGIPEPAPGTWEERAFRWAARIALDPPPNSVDLPGWIHLVTWGGFAVASAFLSVFRLDAATFGFIPFFLLVVLYHVLSKRHARWVIATIRSEEEQWKSRFKVLRDELETFLPGM